MANKNPNQNLTKSLTDPNQTIKYDPTPSFFFSSQNQAKKLERKKQKNLAY
jgi:hypothetical protein